ncbi:MAG: hypothetical protein ACFFD2_02525, partial [Promethearchaeota archaeon]
TSTVGVFNYTIEYNNSNGIFGIPNTVIVTINKPPIPGFLLIFVLFGFLSLIILKKKLKISI